MPQFKVGKTFEFKEYLQRYLHLPPFKDTSGALESGFSRIQCLGVYYQHFLLCINDVNLFY